MVMAALLAAIMAMGCATQNPQTSQAIEAEAAVPFLRSKLTVDEVLAKLRTGKPMPELGVPFIAGWRALYFLADGSLTETRDSFRIVRKGGGEDFVFKKLKVLNK